MGVTLFTLRRYGASHVRASLLPGAVFCDPGHGVYDRLGDAPVGKEE